jgi:glycosyltransferase involved in cell wall biosynthesis
VSISEADRAPELTYAATIHHGIDLEALPFSAVSGEKLVVFGRIHPDKGTAAAIEIARRAGRRLVICGIVQDERYFREEVQPHIDGDRVCYLGSVGPSQRAEVLGAAAALLHPIAFPEPFGLSVVEAMACGTPVIGSNVGGIKYSVVDEHTGFLVPPHQPELLAEKINRLLQDTTLYHSMRKHAIKHVRNNFTWNKVAVSVHQVYNDVLKAIQKPAKVPVMQKITDHASLLNSLNFLPGFKSSMV